MTWGIFGLLILFSAGIHNVLSCGVLYVTSGDETTGSCVYGVNTVGQGCSLPRAIEKINTEPDSYICHEIIIEVSTVSLTTSDAEYNLESRNAKIMSGSSGTVHIMGSGTTNTTLLGAMDSEIELRDLVVSGFSGNSKMGAIYALNSTLHSMSCSFYNNSAMNGGGAINVFGGSVYLDNSEFLYNTGLVCGAVFVFDVSSATIVSSTFMFNQADELGGALCLRSTNNATILDTTIAHNKVIEGEGGGVTLYESHNVTFKNSNVSSNLAMVGGGIYSSLSSEVVFYDTMMTQNCALYSGGAVSFLYTDGVFMHTVLRNNKAYYGGGLEAAYTSHFVLQNMTQITMNTAGATGGGLFVHVYSNGLITDDSFTKMNYVELEEDRYEDTGADAFVGKGSVVEACPITYNHILVQDDSEWITPDRCSFEPSLEPTVEPSSKPTAEPTPFPTHEPTNEPTLEPSPMPSPAPTLQPTAPTLEPTQKPTLHPTHEPTNEPTLEPTIEPTLEPTAMPSRMPSSVPTLEPSQMPSSEPTPEASLEPTRSPSAEPTPRPTASPSSEPTPRPSLAPTTEPTVEPTLRPSLMSLEPSSTPTAPTLEPTLEPTPAPTQFPTLEPTADPSLEPTDSPTLEPTLRPTLEPTSAPTPRPTLEPTPAPSLEPTSPTLSPTSEPSQNPTAPPTHAPSHEPTSNPTHEPSNEPTLEPTANPTLEPTLSPSLEPTLAPTMEPTSNPTLEPTHAPSIEPTSNPTLEPTLLPTLEPTSNPTLEPTYSPSLEPTSAPTLEPTSNPTLEPTHAPSIEPTLTPTIGPTVKPTHTPTLVPTLEPTSHPTVEPSLSPTLIPTIAPTLEPTAAPSIRPTTFQVELADDAVCETLELTCPSSYDVRAVPESAPDCVGESGVSEVIYAINVTDVDRITFSTCDRFTMTPVNMMLYASHPLVDSDAELIANASFLVNDTSCYHKISSTFSAEIPNKFEYNFVYLVVEPMMTEETYVLSVECDRAGTIYVYESEDNTHNKDDCEFGRPGKMTCTYRAAFKLAYSEHFYNKVNIILNTTNTIMIEDGMIMSGRGDYEDMGSAVEVTVWGHHTEINGQSNLGDAPFLHHVIKADVLFYDVTFTGFTAKDFAGVFMIGTCGNVFFSNCMFTGNEAKFYGGAILVYGKDSMVGAENTVFHHNMGMYGGAIAIGMGGTGMFEHVEFLKNTASVHGGSVFISGGAMDCEMCRFVDNTAESGNGGAIASINGSSLLLMHSNVTSNLAWNGGGLYVSYPMHFETMITHFMDNCATFKGGAIHLEDGHDDMKSLLSYGNMTMNKAYYGGALSVEAAMMDIDELMIHDNLAFGTGGGAFVCCEAVVKALNDTSRLIGNTNMGGEGMEMTGLDLAAVKNGTFISCPPVVDDDLQATGGLWQISGFCISPAPSPAPTRMAPTEAPQSPTPEPSLQPSSEPTLNPSLMPTDEPTIEPTYTPTLEPSLEPTNEPTIEPTHEPTNEPTIEPTNSPTLEPSLEPTNEPTIEPTREPTNEPTIEPTYTPTLEPSLMPTNAPTIEPTHEPTYEPTTRPTYKPSLEPSLKPTFSPTVKPSLQPTLEPTIGPTNAPTLHPTPTPTSAPTSYPTSNPTLGPTQSPSSAPTAPTLEPTLNPTSDPTPAPTPFSPTKNPTPQPTFSLPTLEPTPAPTREPTNTPTLEPTPLPTAEPTAFNTPEPSQEPTFTPSLEPTRSPSAEPTPRPTASPSSEPTPRPTLAPTTEPTVEPTLRPSLMPTTEPTMEPTFEPTLKPTLEPTMKPTLRPTLEPTIEPTLKPTVEPTMEPTDHPTHHPSLHPSTKPTPMFPSLEPTMSPTGLVFADTAFCAALELYCPESNDVRLLSAETAVDCVGTDLNEAIYHVNMSNNGYYRFSTCSESTETYVNLILYEDHPVINPKSAIIAHAMWNDSMDSTCSSGYSNALEIFTDENMESIFLVVEPVHLDKTFDISYSCFTAPSPAPSHEPTPMPSGEPTPRPTLPDGDTFSPSMAPFSYSDTGAPTPSGGGFTLLFSYRIQSDIPVPSLFLNLTDEEQIAFAENLFQNLTEPFFLTVDLELNTVTVEVTGDARRLATGDLTAEVSFTTGLLEYTDLLADCGLSSGVSNVQASVFSCFQGVFEDAAQVCDITSGLLGLTYNTTNCVKRIDFTSSYATVQRNDNEPSIEPSPAPTVEGQTMAPTLEPTVAIEFSTTAQPTPTADFTSVFVYQATLSVPVPDDFDDLTDEEKDAFVESLFADLIASQFEGVDLTLSSYTIEVVDGVATITFTTGRVDTDELAAACGVDDGNAQTGVYDCFNDIFTDSGSVCDSIGSLLTDYNATECEREFESDTSFGTAIEEDEEGGGSSGDDDTSIILIAVLVPVGVIIIAAVVFIVIQKKRAGAVAPQ